MTKILPKNFNLGYACINTELREHDIFMSRTCRLQTFITKGLDHVQNLAMHNLQDIMKILEWNVKNGIYFLRLSSEIFPFTAHLKFGYSLDFADAMLQKIGAYAKAHGIRLTMHPGQHCILSSPHGHVIENSVSDLRVHTEILDRMRMGADSVIIIHGGGVYGHKRQAIIRLANNIKKLPANVRSRLVLENDEMSYSIEDLLPLCEALQIPLVIDFHHDAINPSAKPPEYYFKRVFKIWHDRGIKPKVHISTSCPDVKKTDNIVMRRKHSDYINMIYPGLLKIKEDVDVMIEAKMKEKALLYLRDVGIYKNHKKKC
jgi:UV DNA damage endonuclease